MLDMLEYEWLLTKYGWVIECLSPKGIKHKDGSIATGQAVDLVLEDLKIKEGLVQVQYI